MKVYVIKEKQNIKQIFTLTARLLFAMAFLIQTSKSFTRRCQHWKPPTPVQFTPVKNGNLKVFSGNNVHQDSFFSTRSRWGPGNFSDHNIALLVTYDGTDFEGFTEPGTKRSVEKWLRTCLQKIHSHEKISLRAASRTDKGVHAQGQVVCYRPSSLPLGGDYPRLTFSLNRMLPDEIRVKAAAPAPFSDFHPTFDAVKKQYSYQIDISRIQDPMRRLYSWHCPPKHDGTNQLNIEKMQEAANFLVGCRDFRFFRSAFKGNERGREEIQNTVCHISLFEILQHEGNRNSIQIHIQGDRFLYKMVRNMVGMMVQVGRDQISPSDVPDIVEKVKLPPNVQKLCAPAHGLTLDTVEYTKEIFISRGVG